MTDEIKPKEEFGRRRLVRVRNRPLDDEALVLREVRRAQVETMRLYNKTLKMAITAPEGDFWDIEGVNHSVAIGMARLEMIHREIKAGIGKAEFRHFDLGLK